MVSLTQAFDAKHEGLIHDAKFDYYGKRLATCAADGYINIFNVNEGEAPSKTSSIYLHKNAVFQVTWAHPKFGSLIASCGYDGKIFVIKEVAQNTWNEVYCFDASSPVIAIDWAPWEHGLILAAGTSSGNILLLTRQADDHWEHKQWLGHGSGVNAVSWAPAVNLSSSDSSEVTKQLASAGGDNLVKVWTIQEGVHEFPVEELEGHQDWVRDVSWAPNIGTSVQTIASCGEDKKVYIWTREGAGRWQPNDLALNIDVPVWRVSWSVAGNLLAVSGADNVARVFKESTDGRWELVSNLKSDGALESSDG